jgi:hypothetical protein
MLMQIVQKAGAMAHPELALGPLLLVFAVLAPAADRLAARARGSRPAAIAAAAFLAAAVTLTLARPGLRGSGLDWDRVATACTVTDYGSWGPEALLNLLLLAPFAALAVLAGGHPVLVSLFAGLVSLGIETAQAALAVGACDSSDLLRNTAGAALAAFLATAVRPARIHARTLVDH